MRITSVTGYPVKEWRTFLFVVLETDAGISGLGEAGLTGHERETAAAIEALSQDLVGEDPSRIEHLWQMMSRGRFYPAGPIVGSAIAAIDMALWDIKGKALAMPVYELLGGRVRDRVVTYPHIHGNSVDDLVAAARQKVGEGWRFVRWGLPVVTPGISAPAAGRGPSAPSGDAGAAGTSPVAEAFEPGAAVRRAVCEFAALREALGDEVELCLDVHTRLDPSDAVTLCREVERYRPYFIEDPLRSEDGNRYRALRARTGVPLAAGEQFSSKWEFRQLIEEDLIDYARIDPAICGGLTEARKIAGWCETHHIRVAVHNPIGPVSTAACLHFNLATSNFGVQELPRRPGESLPDLILHQAEWRDGYLLPPERPGLGIEIDLSVLDKYPYEPARLPQLRREDGSVTNW